MLEGSRQLEVGLTTSLGSRAPLTPPTAIKPESYGSGTRHMANQHSGAVVAEGGTQASNEGRWSDRMSRPRSTDDLVHLPHHRVMSPDGITFDVGSEENKEYAAGRSGKWGTIFNFVNTIVGAGIIGLPFAIYQCGFWTGLTLLGCAALLIDQSSVMLVVSGERAGKLNYEELMGLMFGKAGYNAFCFFAGLMATGAMIAYLIIIGDTVPEALLGMGVSSNNIFTDRQATIGLLSFFIVLPLASLRDMHNMAFVSFLSVVCVGFIVLIVLFAAPGESENDTNIHRDETFTVIRSTVFAGFGAISFAFVCQSSTFILYRSLKSHRRTLEYWTSITHAALLMAWGLSASLALIGYLSFVDTTEADILNNFSTDNGAANAARIFLAITMLFTYPMEMVVARHVLDAAICQQLWGLGETTQRRHYTITVLLWMATTFFALATNNLGAVLEVFGAFAASAIGYVMPALLYLKTHETEVRSAIAAGETWREKAFLLKPYFTAFIMAVFGVIVMFVGTITAIIDEV